MTFSAQCCPQGVRVSGFTKISIFLNSGPLGAQLYISSPPTGVCYLACRMDLSVTHNGFVTDAEHALKLRGMHAQVSSNSTLSTIIIKQRRVD